MPGVWLHLYPKGLMRTVPAVCHWCLYGGPWELGC